MASRYSCNTFWTKCPSCFCNIEYHPTSMQLVTLKIARAFPPMRPTCFSSVIACRHHGAKSMLHMVLTRRKKILLKTCIVCENAGKSIPISHHGLATVPCESAFLYQSTTRLPQYPPDAITGGDKAYLHVMTL